MVRFSISDFQELTASRDKTKLVVSTGFLKPVHIVMCSALHVYRNIPIIFQNTNLERYAENMSYHAPLEIDTIDGAHHSKAIKLRSAYDSDEQVKKIMRIIEDNASFDQGTIDTLSIIVAELFQNFYAHAESSQPPICCLQDWPSGDHMEIAVADRGIGIEKSLERVLADRPDIKNPCRFACENSVSAKLGKGHSGYGLYFTKRFVEENQGKLFLASGQNCYENDAGAETDHILPYKWQGTVIRLIVNKNKPIDSEEFFRQIAREQEGEDYDEFF